MIIDCQLLLLTLLLFIIQLFLYHNIVPVNQKMLSVFLTPVAFFDVAFKF